MEAVKTHFFADTTVMLGRSMRHVFRSVDAIITGTIMPIALMLVFVYVLGGAIESGTENYVNYLLPGVLAICVANSIGYVAYRLFLDKQRGIFERFHSMPIARSAAIWGHVLTSLVSIFISLAVIIGVALLMGFRSPAGAANWLLAVGILALFTLALAWVVAISGLMAKTVDGASVIGYPIHFLPLASSAFVPTETMPGPVRWFAEHQPVTAVVESVRALLGNQPVGAAGWTAVAWCVGIMVVAYAVAMRVYKRRG